ncbi:MAG: hypothetical protein ABSE55_17500 [Terracidiphilus sp.]
MRERGPASPGTGHKMASPSEVESAAGRIDLDFQRIVRYGAGSGWPHLAARVGRKAAQVIL